MDSIQLAYWQFWLLLAFALWALLDRLLIPSIRWLLRRRLNKLIHKVNQTLDIQIRPFQLTKRKVLLDRLIFDPQVMQAVDDFASKYHVPRQVVQDKVKIYAHEIVPAFNAYIYYRVGYWIAKGLARWLYDVRVEVNSSRDLDNIDPEATVVFVMNHRSNMDYILVSFLASRRTTLSYAVGEWARIWPLQSLLKAMGAFFVRRNSRNNLYRKVLERYISMATKEGVCQAMFPEGGLSRDGQLKPPKLGLLDYMLRDFDYKKDRDVLFIPVGINYDRTLEDRTLLRSLNSEVEKKGTWFAIKTTLKFWGHNLKLMWKHHWKNFGYAAVTFGSPVSAKAFAIDHHLDFATMEKQARFEQIKVFSQQLFSAVADVVPVLPISVICRIFQLTSTEKLSRLTLKGRALVMLENSRKNGAPEVIKKGQWDDSLNAAIDMLLIRHLLVELDGMLQIARGQKLVIAYYGNSAAHWFDDNQS